MQLTDNIVGKSSVIYKYNLKSKFDIDNTFVITFKQRVGTCQQDANMMKWDSLNLVKTWINW